MFKKRINRKFMYEDKRGYLRYKKKLKGQSNLVHRNVAYKEIYLPNKHRYKYSFTKYVVDHRDMNKKNHKASNLRIMLPDEHTDSHTAFNYTPEDWKYGLKMWLIVTGIILIILSMLGAF